jgi:hypothetical protein
MNFGYLLITSKDQNIDYNKLAYALALSIKNTQREGFDRVCLVTDDTESIGKFKSPWVFDQVIEASGFQGWEGRSHMDQLTPFDYTICLDVDMLFLNDCSHWAEYFIKNVDLFVPNKVFTYRNELVTSDYYRKTFTENKLPNLYSLYTFFNNDSEIVKEFFELQRSIFSNPVEYSNLFLQEHKPKVVGTDEAFSLAHKILDINLPDLDFPKIVHMKGQIQNWPWPADDWTDHVGFYFNKSGLKVGNFQQKNLIHYVDKNIITDEVISILEEVAWKK